MQTHGQTGRGARRVGFCMPPMFKGAGGNSWLLKIQNTHEPLKTPVSQRAGDAVSWLSGSALRSIL